MFSVVRQTAASRTVRPSLGLDKLIERRRRNNLTCFVVTTPDGKLVGVALRDESERLLAG